MNVEDITPKHVLAERVWSGSEYHYPHIDSLLARISELKALAEQYRIQRDQAWEKLARRDNPSKKEPAP